MGEAISNKTLSNKSLVEQIFDEMMINLEKIEEFDKHTVEDLKQLIKNGDITKTDKVIDILDMGQRKP